jgi:uncharacterized protein YecE (DUF72 family)
VPQLRIGTSGWSYPRWRGDFYPAGLAHHDELGHLARRLRTVEVNASFYGLQRPETYRAWAEQTPDGFVFAVKGSRYLTHLKRLTDPETALANFFASGLLALGPKLGPVLWQLPESLPLDLSRLAAFVALLPRTTEAVARLARRHDARVEGRAVLEPDDDRPVRHAVEVRHGSYQDGRFVELLRAAGVALVVSDGAGRWPILADVTADFCYLRLHGPRLLYAGGYSAALLDTWAARIRAWTAGRTPPDLPTVTGHPPAAPGGRDVYVYFDNDSDGRAPFDAVDLATRLAEPR